MPSGAERGRVERNEADEADEAEWSEAERSGAERSRRHRRDFYPPNLRALSNLPNEEHPVIDPPHTHHPHIVPSFNSTPRCGGVCVGAHGECSADLQLLLGDTAATPLPRARPARAV